jgi:hypothetical protein
MFQTVPLAIIRSFPLYTQQWYMDQNGTAVPSWSCSQPVSKPVWRIPLLCVQWKTPDDGQRNCLKHVEFHSKNKFEKLVHLVGFIIRDCYLNFVNATTVWSICNVCMAKQTPSYYFVVLVTTFDYQDNVVGIVTRLQVGHLKGLWFIFILSPCMLLSHMFNKTNSCTIF